MTCLWWFVSGVLAGVGVGMGVMLILVTLDVRRRLRDGAQCDEEWVEREELEARAIRRARAALDAEAACRARRDADTLGEVPVVMLRSSAQRPTIEEWLELSAELRKAAGREEAP
jgi:hypothetical protein